MAQDTTPPQRPRAEDVHPDAAELENRAPPVLTRVTLYGLLAFAVIAVTWATFSKVDVIVTAQGRLITTAQPIIVQALQTSVVRSIDVKVGQPVKKGDVIATLDPTFSAADVAEARQRLRSLAAEIGRLRAELDGQKYAAVGSAEDDVLQLDLFEKRTQEYRARVDGYRAELARHEADLAGTQVARKLLRERVEQLRQIETMKADLVPRGVVSMVEVLEARDRRLEVEKAHEDTVSRENQLGQQITQARTTLDAYVRSWRQKILEDLLKAQRERDALKEQLGKAERRGELVSLVAPADAVVLEINRRTVGSVAREADPIVTLVPQGVPLEAEIQIASEDVGFVRVKDPVRVKIDAFPFQKHGVITGRLAVVGGDSVPVDPAAAASGRGPTRAHYSARVTEMTNTLRQVPGDTQLVPGMTLTAEIRVGERTVISYFLYPLTKAFGESIREP